MPACLLAEAKLTLRAGASTTAGEAGSETLTPRVSHSLNR